MRMRLSVEVVGVGFQAGMRDPFPEGAGPVAFRPYASLGGKPPTRQTANPLMVDDDSPLDYDFVLELCYDYDIGPPKDGQPPVAGLVL